jgi:branched-chain amino acid transport system ATP-binding protein
VIGPNGAGKTTFISQLAGMLRPDSGRISFAGEDITRLTAPRRARKGLARSFQITSIYLEFTALQNVALAVQAHAGHSFSFWRDARTDPSLVEPAAQILREMNLHERRNVLAANLSHGEQRQLEVAMALATRPRLLLLDEPMAGMGIEDSQRMIAFLGSLKQRHTMILVEHDMDAVFRLADRISVLVYGRVIATDTPEKIRANEEVRRAYLGEDF